MAIAEVMVDHVKYVDSTLCQLIHDIPSLDNAATIERTAFAFGKVTSFIEEQRVLARERSDASADKQELEKYNQLAENIADDLVTATMFHVDEPDGSYQSHLQDIENKLSKFLSDDFRKAVD